MDRKINKIKIPKNIKLFFGATWIYWALALLFTLTYQVMKSYTYVKPEVEYFWFWFTLCIWFAFIIISTSRHRVGNTRGRILYYKDKLKAKWQ